MACTVRCNSDTPSETRPSVVDDPEQNAAIMERWRGLIQDARESFRRLDVATAEQQLKQALEEAAHFGHSSPPMATSLLNLAQLYRRAGRLADAEPLLIRAADVLENSAGPNNKVTLLALMDLASTQLGLGNSVAAAARFDDILGRLEVAEVQQAHGKAALRTVRAGCLLEASKADVLLGHTEKAETRLKLALQLGAERWGPDSNKLAGPYYELAALLLSSNRHEEAVAMCKRASTLVLADKIVLVSKIEELRGRLAGA